MCDVITMGEPMVMFLADTKEDLSKVNHFLKMIAGAELNVAMGVRRMGHSVSYLTQVGNDPFGEYVRDFLKQESIDDSLVRIYGAAPTGFRSRIRSMKEILRSSISGKVPQPAKRRRKSSTISTLTTPDSFTLPASSRP